MVDFFLEVKMCLKWFYSFLRGYCTSYQKWVWFVLYLKIINNFLKNNYAFYLKKMLKELKNGIEILVGQAVFKL